MRQFNSSKFTLSRKITLPCHVYGGFEHSAYLSAYITSMIPLNLPRAKINDFGIVCHKRHFFAIASARGEYFLKNKNFLQQNCNVKHKKPTNTNTIITIMWMHFFKYGVIIFSRYANICFPKHIQIYIWTNIRICEFSTKITYFCYIYPKFPFSLFTKAKENTWNGKFIL